MKAVKVSKPDLRFTQINLHHIPRTLFVCPTVEAPRVAILTKVLEAMLMPELCTWNLVVIELRLNEQDGTRRGSSAFFPYDSRDPPSPAKVARLLEFCRTSPLLLEFASSTWSSLWVSSSRPWCPLTRITALRALPGLRKWSRGGATDYRGSAPEHGSAAIW